MSTASSNPRSDGRGFANRSEAELVHLQDGSSMTICPTSAQDEPALRAFLSGLALEAQRLRFFTGAPDIDHAAHLAAASDAEQCGLIARDEHDAVVGHATYVQLDGERAEVAVEIADDLHGRGLGTILIEQLAAIAEGRGLTQFVAKVLPENRAMLDVFRDGFDARLTYREGTDTVVFPTASWRLAFGRFAQDTALAHHAGASKREL
jgi:GNAT superfamily N-acetyltransferase